MKENILYLLLIVFVLIQLSGCKGLDEFRVQRSVENNVVYSSSPELTIKINQEFKYIGEVTFDKESKGESREAELHQNILKNTSYLFGQFDQGGRLSKGIYIRLIVITGDPSQPGQDQTVMGRSILDSGKEKILDEEYQSLVFTQNDIFTKEEKTLLPQASTTTCYLVKLLQRKAGLGNKSRVEIYYYEDISSECGNSSCNECLKPGMLTDSQKQLMHDFTETSYASIRFMEPRKTIDTTSRYVDTETKAQPAEKASTGIEPFKADTVEKRLQALKSLFEKDLISKEEYEKKKAEILKGL
jgi:hypothetical protein